MNPFLPHEGGNMADAYDFPQFRVAIMARGEREWAYNLRTFRDVTSAQRYAADLSARWTMVRAWQVERKGGVFLDWLPVPETLVQY